MSFAVGLAKWRLAKYDDDFVMPVVLMDAVRVAAEPGTCAGSPMRVLDDFVPAHSARTETVAGIASVQVESRVVGWTYRTKSGRFFIQGRRSMPTADQQRFGISGFNLAYRWLRDLQTSVDGNKRDKARALTHARAFVCSLLEELFISRRASRSLRIAHRLRSR